MNVLQMVQGSGKVRALNLSKWGKNRIVESEKIAKMANLHYLILDGCAVSGEFGSISSELRWLRWRYMPLTQLPPMQNFSKLISLDFSESTEVANIWVESDPALEVCFTEVLS